MMFRMVFHVHVEEGHYGVQADGPGIETIIQDVLRQP